MKNRKKENKNKNKKILEIKISNAETFRILIKQALFINAFFKPHLAAFAAQAFIEKKELIHSCNNKCN